MSGPRLVEPLTLSSRLTQDSAAAVGVSAYQVRVHPGEPAALEDEELADGFVSWWFASYMPVRTLATFGRLWVLSRLVRGHALPLFGASSVVLPMLLSVTRAQRRADPEDGRWRSALPSLPSWP